MPSNPSGATTTGAYTQEDLKRYFSDPKNRKNGYEEYQRSKKSKSAMKAVAAVAGFIAFLTLCMTVYMAILVNDLPSLNVIQNPKMALATIAYTTDGKELTRYLEDNRTWVDLKDISPWVKKALIATEDKRFYDHWGIDLQRTMSVPFHVLRGSRQGGSTITQQLARNLFPEVGNQNSAGRKLKEMMTAVELERIYTKDEIIELYLNTIEYMYYSHGIDAASKIYFNKKPANLNVLEAATLVGMVQNPVLYNPTRQKFVGRTQERRNVVLSQMVKSGDLSQSDYDQLKDKPIELDFTPIKMQEGSGSYFSEYVRQFLNEWGERNGYDIYRDGLRVYTTLDSQLQLAAEKGTKDVMDGLQAVVDVEWSMRPGACGSLEGCKAVMKSGNLEAFGSFWKNKIELVNEFIGETPQAKRLVNRGASLQEAVTKLREDQAFMDSLKAEKTRIEVGLVAVDPTTGYIKAWVGGRDFGTDKYDHVSIAKRQPGSTFKPFVYAAAFDKGYSPYYWLKDAARTINCEGVRGWKPLNSGSRGSGANMTLRQGLIMSKNTITAQLGCKIGSRTIVDFARRVGVNKSLTMSQAVPAISLGTAEVTLLELAQGYSTLANYGVKRDLIPVTRIEDRNGNVIATFGSTGRDVVDPSVAYMTMDVLRGVISQGTGKSFRGTFGVSGAYDIAGKTGTTQESSDGWFMMAHPKLVAGSWVGFNDRRVKWRSSTWGQGARTGMYAVGGFMRNVVKEGLLENNVRFTPPPGYKPPKAVRPPGSGFGRRIPKRPAWKKPTAGKTGTVNRAKRAPVAPSAPAAPAPDPASPAPAPPPVEERRFDWR